MGAVPYVSANVLAWHEARVASRRGFYTHVHGAKPDPHKFVKLTLERP